MHLNTGSIKVAMGGLLSEGTKLERNKVSLITVTANGRDILEGLDCLDFLRVVFGIMGVRYRSIVSTLTAGPQKTDDGGGLKLSYVRERVAVMGDLSESISEMLGMQLEVETRASAPSGRAAESPEKSA
jgi:hypothetical protein